MSDEAGATRLAVDIGGTFTDIVLQTPDRIASSKLLTTPHAPERAVLDGLSGLLESESVSPADRLGLRNLSQYDQNHVAVKVEDCECPRCSGMPNPSGAAIVVTLHDVETQAVPFVRRSWLRHVHLLKRSLRHQLPWEDLASVSVQQHHTCDILER